MHKNMPIATSGCHTNSPQLLVWGPIARRIRICEHKEWCRGRGDILGKGGSLKVCHV